MCVFFIGGGWGVIEIQIYTLFFKTSPPRDLGSCNGTALNNMRVKSLPMTIKPGSVLRFGKDDIEKGVKCVVAKVILHYPKHEEPPNKPADTDEEPSQSLLAVAKAEEKAFMDVKRHKPADTDEEPSQSLLAVAKAEEKAFMDVKRHKMVNGMFSWNLSLDIDNI